MHWNLLYTCLYNAIVHFFGLIIHLQLLLIPIFQFRHISVNNFLITVLYFQVNSILFFQWTVHFIDKSLLNLVFNPIQPDDFPWHKIMWEFFCLDGCFDDLCFTLFEFVRVEEFDEIIDFTLHPGEGILCLIIMQEGKLNLFKCHWWRKLSLMVKHSQIHYNHYQQYN